MCTVLLPPGVNPITVNKYIIYHRCERKLEMSQQVVATVNRYTLPCKTSLKFPCTSTDSKHNSLTNTNTLHRNVDTNDLDQRNTWATKIGKFRKCTALLKTQTLKKSYIILRVHFWCVSKLRTEKCAHWLYHAP